jgi:serine/threonine-protein kinase
VHRDVKPGNIRIHLPARMVKVADFGVARGDDSARTRTGVIVGSPVYMAPEQLAGAEAAPAADLYALGVVLFELLTGGVPYASGSFGELLRQVAAEPAPDLRTRRPELPQDLAQIVARVLAKRPDARFADGDTLAAALQAVTLHGL